MNDDNIKQELINLADEGGFTASLLGKKEIENKILYLKENENLHDNLAYFGEIWLDELGFPWNKFPGDSPDDVANIYINIWIERLEACLKVLDDWNHALRKSGGI